jgi:hypothetical protein
LLSPYFFPRPFLALVGVSKHAAFEFYHSIRETSVCEVDIRREFYRITLLQFGCRGLPAGVEILLTLYQIY